MINLRRAFALLSALVLTACGGGGGGSNNDWLTFSPTPLKVSAFDRVPQTFQVTAHSSRVISQQIYVKIVDASGVTDGNVQLDQSSGDGQTIVATLTTASTLQTGSHTGTFAVWLYTDAAMTQVYSGSPWNVPYDIEVAPRHAEHRVFADRQAVALAAFPTASKSRLTASIRLDDNQGQATPWLASSDQSWLTVTASGNVGAGMSLNVTADPSSLPADALSLATITITSSGASIAAPEIVRVGLWKSSTDPTSHSTALPFARLAADPLRPYVYGISPNTGGINNAVIDVFNVYSGTVIGTITPDPQSPISSASSPIAVSNDGRRLYVGENANHVAVYDLETRTFTRSIPMSVQVGSRDDQPFQLLRVDGHELLVTAYGQTTDLDTGKELAASVSGFPSNAIVHWDPYRWELYAISSGTGAGQATRWSVDWIDSDGGAVLFDALQARSLAAMYCESGGLSPDGSVLYAGTGSFQSTTLAASPGELPQADPARGGMLYQIRVGPDGRRYAYYLTGELYVFAADGTQLVHEELPQTEDEVPLEVSSDGVVAAISHTVNGISLVEFRVF